MRHRRTLLVVPILLALMVWGPAVGNADMVADCNQTTHLDRQIRACTIVLEERRTTSANLAIALINRANAYALQKRYPQALQDYAAAIAIHPEDTLAYYNRANVHFDLGNSADAIVDYTRVIELDPTFALAYFNRGLAREKSGDKVGAIADYERVLALEPTAAKARARLRSLGADIRNR